MTARPSIVTALVLSAGPLLAQADWTQINTNNAPTDRLGHAMAYDAARDEVVLFGGSDSGVGITGGTWLLDGTDWRQASPPTEPPIRVAHEMVYDPVRQRTVLFGGLAPGVLYSDTWEWDGQTWTQVFPNNVPAARRSHAMAYDLLGGRVLLWGGYDGGQDVADTWAFDGQDWTQIVTANSPPARRATAMAPDLLGGGVILFSGFQVGADTWRFTGTDWVQLSPTNVPPQRYDHMMANDVYRQRVVLFGGPGLNDTWEWNGADWEQRSPANAPPAREDSFLAYDSLRQRIVMFGGFPRTADTWIYETSTPASYDPFGNGCGTTGGVPLSLSATGLPWANETITLRARGFSGTAAVAMLTGFSNTTWGSNNLPFDLSGFGATGCSLLVEPFVAFGIPNNSGSASLPLAIGTDPGLLGLSFYNQAVAVQPGANPLGVLVSNGGAGTIGAR